MRRHDLFQALEVSSLEQELRELKSLDYLLDLVGLNIGKIGIPLYVATGYLTKADTVLENTLVVGVCSFFIPGVVSVLLQKVKVVKYQNQYREILNLEQAPRKKVVGKIRMDSAGFLKESSSKEKEGKRI